MSQDVSGTRQCLEGAEGGPEQAANGWDRLTCMRGLTAEIERGGR
jgi:hypothetical protein